MTSSIQPESGHYKNLSNFHALVSFCTELGTDYKPGKADLSPDALQACSAQCQQLLTDLHNCDQALHVATVSRKNGFDALQLLAPRVVHNMKAINADAPELKAAQHLIKKMSGHRIQPIDPPAADAAADDAAKHISAAQTGFDAQVDHFSQLLQLVASQGGYTANEPMLQLDKLQSILEGVSIQNKQVVDLGHRRKLLMARRAELFYGRTNSMLANARAIKQYIYAAFGNSSQQGKRVQAFPVKNLP